MTNAVLPRMRARKSGLIVLMGSRSVWQADIPVSTFATIGCRWQTHDQACRPLPTTSLQRLLSTVRDRSTVQPGAPSLTCLLSLQRDTRSRSRSVRDTRTARRYRWLPHNTREASLQGGDPGLRLRRVSRTYSRDNRQRIRPLAQRPRKGHGGCDGRCAERGEG